MNHKPEAEKSSGGNTYLGSINWLGPFLWIIIIAGFLIFIAWWYVNNGQGSLFRRDPKTLARENESDEIKKYLKNFNRGFTMLCRTGYYLSFIFAILVKSVKEF